MAETAPIILNGLADCLKKIQEIHPVVIKVDSKDSLFKTLSKESVSLMIVNPIFAGLLHPDEIRKVSLNSEIKIFALEISKLNKATLALFDDNIHVTDDVSLISRKVKHALSSEIDSSYEKESLSTREKEIISLVVKGFTNQEIADKLFLSVHTVMTHRKNIARKLQIHSATGLTIYAIVNKIVDLTDIRL